MTDSVFLENKRLNESEIRERKTKLSSKVRSLVVTLTTKCNIACIMCEEKFIPWDIPPSILEEVISLFPYLEDIIWQGGEVLILDYFRGLLEKANKFPHLHQSIITNGLPIDEALAKELVRDNIELTFSIDAVTKESYEFVRKKGNFERLLESIALVNSLRKKGGFRNMAFRMHTVVMKSNYRELEMFVEFAKAHEFDALHLMPIWGNLDSPENIFYHKNAEALGYLDKNIGKAVRKAKDYGLDLLNSLPFKGEREEDASHGNQGGHLHAPQEGGAAKEGAADNGILLCHMPWKRMVINPAGYVCPACHCKEMVGNVSEDTLNNIWNNEKMQEYRAKISCGDYSDLCSANCINGIISEELRGLR